MTIAAEKTKNQFWKPAKANIHRRFGGQKSRNKNKANYAAVDCSFDMLKQHGKVENGAAEMSTTVIDGVDSCTQPSTIATRAGLAMTLTVLGSLTPILIQASRVHDARLHAPEKIVCAAEAVKALLCAAASTASRISTTTTTARNAHLHAGRTPFFTTSAKLGALAAMYAVHNNMLIQVVRIVDIATFQVWFTWRVPVTALALRIVMEKRFSAKQTYALALLMLGSTLTRWSGGEDSTQHTAVSLRGLAMIFMLVGTSSIASVWNEAMLKDERMGTLSGQNMQLYCFGFLINLGVIWFRNSGGIAWADMISWSPLTWATVASMALLGIVTSATLKYADNIVRAFAAAGSIVLATAISWIVFSNAAGVFFLLGSALTCIAAAAYFW